MLRRGRLSEGVQKRCCWTGLQTFVIVTGLQFLMSAKLRTPPLGPRPFDFAQGDSWCSGRQCDLLDTLLEAAQRSTPT